jgi:hypothetical protein
MTSVTYGMRKSLCKVTFDMYQGALVSFLNVLNTTFRKLDLFPSLVEGRETATVLDSAERTNLNHWATHVILSAAT